VVADAVKGRGSRWVVAQFLLMAAVIATGFVPPDWPEAARELRIGLGVVLIGVGAAFGVWASRELGRALTPFPKPRPAGLVTSGPFSFVRHPIYCGFLAVFVGYSLLSGVLALALTLALAFLWVGKTRVEEAMLVDVYAGYDAYCSRVRWRLIPFVY
jgi:protein-S-isoprenylcysteine O-methyltransferase Ste14